MQSEIELLTLDEVAALAGKTRTAIMHHILHKRIPYRVVGGRYLIERQDWEQFRASYTWANRRTKKAGVVSMAMYRHSIPDDPLEKGKPSNGQATGLMREDTEPKYSENGDSVNHAQKLEIDGQHYKRAKIAPIPMRDEAYDGILGEAVRIAAPKTEACPEALLCQLLVAVGNIIGRNPYFNQGDCHRTVTNVVLVGDTSAGRKGTSMRVVRSLLEHIDPEWNLDCVQQGIQTGEALINLIRDDRVKIDKNGEEMTIDGIDDKRMLVLEEEFARLLSVGSRKGNPLSAIIRQVFDSPSRIQAKSKTDAETASNPHVSLIAHVTPIELLATVNNVEVGNGFVNRMMFIESRPVGRKPFATVPDWSQYSALITSLKSALAFAGGVERVTWTAKGAKAWANWYNKRIIPGGTIGSILGRAEAHILRVSLIFALLGETDQICEEHFKAALAVWDYAAQSAKRIFGNTTGNKIADKVFSYIQMRGEATRNQIQVDVLNNHGSKHDMDIAISVLVENGMANVRTVPVENGRPVEVVSAITGKN